ncbi:MAG: metallophosphoesterase [Planctomycetaceae bacterium]|nr:metallophosphoesterase [Planctomycetaceae bacterium]
MGWPNAVAIFCLASAPIATSRAATFEIVALPDTQNYNKVATPNIFNTQTSWVANNISSENIAFVTQLGDITDDGTNSTYWSRANSAMSAIDGLVPYSVSFGNHDEHWTIDTGDGVANCLANYGPSRYAAYSWFGGASPNGLANYQTFAAGGMNFLHLNLPYAPDATTLSWANSVLSNPANANKPTIISTHDYLNIDGTRDSVGDSIWNSVVKNNSQVFMVLNGHYHGESQLVSQNSAGNNVLQMISDYQAEPNGGNGWLRKITFDTTANKISVKTYSPSLGQYQTDANSEVAYAATFTGGTVTVGKLLPAGPALNGLYVNNFDSLGTGGTTMPSGFSVIDIGSGTTTFGTSTPITSASMAAAGASVSSDQSLTVWNSKTADSGGSDSTPLKIAGGVNMGATPSATDRALGTAQTSVAAKGIQLCLANSTGAPMNKVVLRYDQRVMSPVTSPVEELPGLKVFYSTTGGSGASDWIEATALQADSATYPSSNGRAAVLNLPTAVPKDGAIYIRWVDDNGTPSPDQAYAIDNVWVMPPVALKGAYAQNFDAMGTGGTSAPNGWVVHGIGGSSGTYTAPSQIGPAVVAAATPDTSQSLQVWNQGSAVTCFAVAGNVGASSAATDRALGTNPTGVGAKVVELMSTNATGVSVKGGVMKFDMKVMAAATSGSEQAPGYKVFYSLTGSSNAADWIELPNLQLTQTSLGTYSARAAISFPTSLADGVALHFRWVDDNGSASPEWTNAIDNVELTLAQPLGSGRLYSQNFNAMGIGGTDLPVGWSVRTIAGSSTTYGAGNLPGAAAVSSSVLTPSQTLDVWDPSAGAKTFGVAANAAAVVGGADRMVATNPTGVGGLAIELLLQNTTGEAIPGIAIQYDLKQLVNNAEELPGYKFFYSLTGGADASEWIEVPALELAADGTANGLIAFETPLCNEDFVYLRWLDDNGTSSPDATYGLDNVCVVAVPEPASLLLLTVLCALTGSAMVRRARR